MKSTAGQNSMILAGVALMLGGDLLFALNDAMGKWLVTNFSVGQVVFIRSFGAFLILGPLIVRQPVRALLRPERPGLQLVRALMTAMETSLFYASVAYLPLADTMSVYMAGPIYVAALAHLVLGEKVGWRRWMAITVGFAGVLVILDPRSSALSFASLYAVAGSLAFAVLIILSRSLRTTSDTTLVTWQTVASLLVGGLLALWDWRTPTAFDIGAMLLLGVVSTGAHLLITRSLKYAPASTLAPLHYSLLLWGILFGFVFFGDVPGTRILIGGAIVVLAGLFIVHREKTVSTVPPENVPRGVN